MKISELLVRIAADTKDFAGPLRTAESGLGSFDKRATSTAASMSKLSSQFASFAGALGVTAGAAGLVELARSAVTARASMESLEKGMASATGSAQKAALEIGKLKEVAKLPGLGFEEAIRGSIALQGAGISAETARRAIGGFGNALALVGKGKAELDGVILALGQIASKGKISAEEINQIAERVPQIRMLMKSAFGTADTEALQKMGISSQVFVDRIIKELERLPKAAGGMKNDLENLADEWATVLNDLGRVVAPVAIQLTSGFVEAAKGIRDAIAIAIIELDKYKNYLGNWLKNAGPTAQAVAASVALMNNPLALFGVGKGTQAPVPAPAGGQSPAPTGPQAPLKLAPTKDQLDKWKKQQEESIKETYQLWDKFAKDMEFLQKRPGLDIQTGVTPSRWHQELADAIKATDQMKELDKELADSKADWSIRTQGALNAVRDKSKELIPVTQTTTGAIIAAWSGVAQGVGVVIASQVDKVTKLREAYQKLGLTMRSDLLLDMKQMHENMKRLEEQAIDTATSADDLKKVMYDLKVASDELAKKKKEADGPWKSEQADLNKKPKQDTIDKKAMQEVSTVFDDLSRNLATLIIDGGKFKTVMVGAAKEISTSFLRLVINEALAPVRKIMQELAKAVVELAGSIIKNLVQGAFKQLGASISGILGGLGKIFGSTASAAGSVAGAASGAAGSAASGAGGAASGVASAGIAGTVGMITGAISAVSGVIGNFQMQGMNKSLDILVKHTLQMVMQGEVMRPFLDNHLSAIHGRLMEIRQIGVRVFTTDAPLAVSWQGAAGAGGGSGYTINMNGSFIGFRDMDSFVDDLVRRIKARL